MTSMRPTPDAYGSTFGPANEGRSLSAKEIAKQEERLRNLGLIINVSSGLAENQLSQLLSAYEPQFCHHFLGFLVRGRALIHFFLRPSSRNCPNK